MSVQNQPKYADKFRDECLKEHWFTDLQDARDKIETWRIDYNQVRPHSSLDDLTPNEFAVAAALREPPARCRLSTGTGLGQTRS